MPALTVVPPLYVLGPESVSVPVPTFASAATPAAPLRLLLRILPLNVESTFSAATLHVVVPAPNWEPMRPLPVSSPRLIVPFVALVNRNPPVAPPVMFHTARRRW